MDELEKETATPVEPEEPRTQTEADLRALPTIITYIHDHLETCPNALEYSLDEFLAVGILRLVKLRMALIDTLKNCHHHSRHSEEFKKIQHRFRFLEHKHIALKSFLCCFYEVRPPCVQQGMEEIMPDRYDYGLPICVEDFVTLQGHKDAKGDTVFDIPKELERDSKFSIPGAIELKPERLEDTGKEYEKQDKEFAEFKKTFHNPADEVEDEISPGMLQNLSRLTTEELKKMAAVAAEERLD